MLTFILIIGIIVVFYSVIKKAGSTTREQLHNNFFEEEARTRKWIIEANEELAKRQQQDEIMKKEYKQARNEYYKEHYPAYADYSSDNVVATPNTNPENRKPAVADISYLAKIKNQITDVYGPNWTFADPKVSKRILYHTNESIINIIVNGETFSIKINEDKHSEPPSPKPANNVQKPQTSSSKKTSSRTETKSELSDSEKRERLHKNKVVVESKEWIDNNLLYMNEAVCAAVDGIVTFESDALPKDKDVWDAIGKSLVDDEEFSSYTVKDNAIEFTL